MNAYDNCTGVAVKFDKINNKAQISSPMYFLINNQGIFNYSFDRNFLIDLLGDTTEEGFNDLKYDLKNMFLKDFYINSEIKIYEAEITKYNELNLNSRSYFELINDEDQSFNLLVFSNLEININQLYEYVKLFCLSKVDDIGEKITTTNKESKIRSKTSLKSINHRSVRDVKYMEEIISKLEGKFVNQDSWDKECIRIVNPTSDKEEYEESWVKLENGSDYSGKVKNFMPSGFGKEYRKDGLIYSGNFFKGKWHGLGTITNINLDNFQGEFIDGCICGI